MIPSDSAQKKKNNHQPVFTKLWWVSDFFFFFAPFFGDESHFLLSTNFLISASIRDRITHIYITSPWCWQKCLAKNTSMFVLCMTRVLKNSADAQCYGWFNSWVLTFREKKPQTWNTKQMANDKMILIYAIKDICNYMQ